MLLLFIDHEYGNRDFRKLEKRLIFHPKYFFMFFEKAQNMPLKDGGQLWVSDRSLCKIFFFWAI